jgi:hypothetical protein
MISHLSSTSVDIVKVGPPSRQVNRLSQRVDAADRQRQRPADPANGYSGSVDDAPKYAT